jgi:RsiW-degrading membrane proteinase PrsW (M82 family)
MKIFRKSDIATPKKIKKDWKERLIVGFVMGILFFIFYLIWYRFLMDNSQISLFWSILSFLAGFILGFIFKEVEIPY